jgi:hypothetical protein
MPIATEDGNHKSSTGLSEIEARMLVLEVVAMTSLALALDTSDAEGAQMGRNVLHLIRQAVGNKCAEMNLSDAAADTAEQYANELVHTAMESLFPREH